MNIERKPHPYGNCTANYFDDLLDMYVGLYGVGYTEMVSTIIFLPVVTQVMLISIMFLQVIKSS